MNLVLLLKPSVTWNNGYPRGKTKQVLKRIRLKVLWSHSQDSWDKLMADSMVPRPHLLPSSGCPPNTSAWTVALQGGAMCLPSWSHLLSIPPPCSPLHSSHTSLCPQTPTFSLAPAVLLPRLCGASASQLPVGAPLWQLGLSSMAFLRLTSDFCDIEIPLSSPPPGPLHHRAQLHVLQCTYSYSVNDAHAGGRGLVPLTCSNGSIYSRHRHTADAHSNLPDKTHPSVVRALSKPRPHLPDLQSTDSKGSPPGPHIRVVFTSR